LPGRGQLGLDLLEFGSQLVDALKQFRFARMCDRGNRHGSGEHLRQYGFFHDGSEGQW